MTRKSLTEFNTSPYYDDFNDEKSFLKVLFKPGTAVQARELNQIQSLIADQISKFGDHIFKDGSPVLNGTFNIDVNCNYIKLHDFELGGQTSSNSVSNYISQLEGRTLVSSDGSIKFLVKKVESSNTTETNVIIGNYKSGGNEVGEGVLLETEPVAGLQDYRVTTAIFDTSEIGGQKTLSYNEQGTVTGKASLASVDEGVFYISGFFTKCLSQTIILEKYSNTPSFKVGLEVDESIITSGDDSSLYDNAQGSPNFSAPGSDRFKTTLILVKKELLESEGNLIVNQIDNNSSFEFYEFVRVLNGDKVDQIKNSQYAYLGEELARRTYETNGDFVVRNFILDVDEYSSDEVNDAALLNPPVDLTEKLKLTLDPGKAYVKGYEIETIAPIEISLDKGRSTGESFEEDINTFLGNYVFVDIDATNLSTLYNEQYNSTNNKLGILDANGAEIGYCRFKQINYLKLPREENTIAPALSFFDLNITESGKSSNDIYQFYDSGGRSQSDIDNSVFPVIFTVSSHSRPNPLDSQDEPITTIEESDESSLLFPVSNSSIQNVTELGYSFKCLLDLDSHNYDDSDSEDSYTEFVIAIPNTLSASGYFSPPNEYQGQWASGNLIFFREEYTNSQNIIQPATIYENADFKVDLSQNRNGYIKVPSLDLTVHPIGKFKAIIRLDSDGANNSSRKKKTKTERNITISEDDDLSNISLGQTDIFELVEIKDLNDKDFLEYFELDNGQRDAFYDIGSIKQIKDFPTGNDEAPTFPINVKFNYFVHGSGSHFDATSYSDPDDPQASDQIPYQDIPIYVSKSTGESFSLSDMIDFRPAIDPNDTNYTTGSKLPHGDGDDRLEVNYNYYLSRIDKISLTKDKQFLVIKGAPSLSPKTPPDDPEAMSLYIVTIPPYTYNDNDVKVVPIHNRRYTMRDIGILDRRIEELQARSNLRLLQEKTKNVQIRNSKGEIFKNGILIDDFSGHSVGDVSSPEYRCSIDFDTKELRPSFSSKSYKLEYVESESKGVTKKGPLILSEYNSVQHQIQPLANKSMNINPHKMNYWFGEIKMNPSSDMWFNQTIDPRVNINDIGENNAWQNLETSVEDGYGKGFGTQWNDWESIWTGKESFISSEENNPNITLQSNVGRLKNVSTQNYLSNSIDPIGTVGTGIPNRIERNVNNRKVDNSVVPFIESGEVVFVATNLKPNEQFWAFFDEKNVTGNITPLTKVNLISSDVSNSYVDGIYDGDIIQVGNGVKSAKVIKNLNDGTGSMYVKMINGTFETNDIITGTNNLSSTILSVSVPTDLKTDKFGQLCGIFTIPSTSSNKFRTGQRLFRLINNNENTLSPSGTQSTPLSLAENSYTSQGIMEDPENFISSTRMPLIKRSNICDILSVSRDPLSRELNSLRRCLDWRDPLSQTFIVDLASNRNGIFLDSIDLYFKSKDYDLPVSIEIRPTSNGFPSTSVVLPFSEVILNPSQVNISAGPDPENNFTRFSFDAPVYLKPGEYAIVVKTNGVDYDLWSGEVGVPVLNTDGTSDVNNQKVTSLPLVGNLYDSHNSGVWEKINNQSIMFRINKCKFTPSLNTSDVPENKNLWLRVETTDSASSLNLFKFNVSMLKNFYNNDNPAFKYRLDTNYSSIGAIPFHENRNVEFSGSNVQIDSDSPFKILSEFLVSESQDVSPVFDLERMSLISVKNNINQSLDPETTDVCYISKQVNLKSPYESKDIRVYLDLYKTPENDINVYYKVGNSNDPTPFSQKSWVLMQQITPSHIFSEYSNDYREFVFGTASGVQLDGFPNFDTYAVKIVMKSLNSSKVPKVRNLRAIALQERTSE